MKDPNLIVRAYWHEAPPPRFHKRIADDHYADPVGGASCVVWRGRWVIITDIAWLGEIDRRLRAGTAGLLWEKA